MVRARFEQLAQGDFSALADVPEDFEFVTSPDVPDAGTYRGEAARQWVMSWVTSFEGLTMEAIELTDAGDKVLVELVQHGGLRGSETAVEGRWWEVDTFRDGVLARTEIFPERAQALKAAGLSE